MIKVYETMRTTRLQICGIPNCNAKVTDIRIGQYDPHDNLHLLVANQPVRPQGACSTYADKPASPQHFAHCDR